MATKTIELNGTPASPGGVEGDVIVVSGTQDRIPKRKILVAKEINTNLLKALANARGIITEEGDPSSLPATLARRHGIPCITRANGATSEIQTGDQVKIDGHTGKVVILKL